MFGDMLLDFLHSNMPCGADKCARSARDADIGLNMKRRIDFKFHTPPGQADGAASHPVTNARTETAQNAIIVFGFKPRFFYAILLRQFLDNGNVRATGQQHLHDNFANLVDILSIGFDLHTFPDGIVAGRNVFDAPAVVHLHDTQPTHPRRFQGLVVTQGRDLDPVLLGDLEKILSFLSLNFLAIERKRNHRD